jgi:hypothetical protein
MPNVQHFIKIAQTLLSQRTNGLVHPSLENYISFTKIV